MLIHEVCRETALTKKAIEYYIEQDLLRPAVSENGYRDFSAGDVERLQKIAALRKLGLSTIDIRAALADETGEALRDIAVRKGLNAKQAEVKRALLDKLSAGLPYPELSAQLEALEKSQAVTEKLLDAFPGYFGRFIALHFARFLNEPITTAEQKRAYREIIAFLDDMPGLAFPDDLKTYWDEATGGVGADAIGAMLEGSERAVKDIEGFLDEHCELLEEYIAFKRSEEYKSSAAGRLQALLKEFCGASGYYDVFIPAMKRLSASYADYIRQMEAANDKLLKRFPQIEAID